eukprot:COSAG06_NODE_21644_length_749_cov_0.826421_2_plen_53_part_01
MLRERSITLTSDLAADLANRPHFQFSCYTPQVHSPTAGRPHLVALPLVLVRRA